MNADENIEKDAIELAEDFTDWMGPSWPMCGGINATGKLAAMANKRLRVAEKAAQVSIVKTLLNDIICGTASDEENLYLEGVADGRLEVIDEIRAWINTLEGGDK